MSLVTPREHIALSWRHYTQHIGRFLEVSLWLLVPSLVQVALLFGLTSSRINLPLDAVWSVVGIAMSVITMVLSVWVQVRLIKLALAHNPKEEGYIATHPRVGWSSFFPLLFVWILTGLAVIGGTALFVIPGIWLFFSLVFASIIVIDTPARGFSALVASFELVRGRWWPVVGRLFLAGLSILGIAFFVSLCISLLLRIVVDTGTMQNMTRLTRLLLIDGYLTADTLRAFSLSSLQDTLLQAIYLPFLTIAQCVLYTSLVQNKQADRPSA